MASTKKRTVVSTMASADKKLEKELLEAGNKLLNPPSSVDILLRLLRVNTLFFFISHFAFFYFVSFMHVVFS